MPRKQLSKAQINWYHTHHLQIKELAKRSKDPLGLTEEDFRVQIFAEQMTGEGCEENRARYLSLLERSKKAKPAEKALLEKELLSFFYFMIFLGTRQENLPWAGHYCDLAYDADPSKSLQDSPAYEYTRNLEAKPPLFSKAPEIYDRYREIARAGRAPQANLAKIKCFLLEAKSLGDVAGALTKFQINHQELTPIIEAEKSWIAVADFAKGFKSSNPLFQKLLDYIAQTTLRDCPNLEDYQKIPPENLREISMEDMRRLEELLLRSEKLYAPLMEGIPPVSGDRTVKAFEILYYNQGLVGQIRWLQAIKYNDPEALYLLCLNYKELSSRELFATLPDEIKADYQELILNMEDNFYANNPGDRDGARGFAIMNFLESSAWAGYPIAQYQVAQIHLADSAVEGLDAQTKIRSREKYLHFLLLAAKNGIADAQYDYAELEYEELIRSSQIQSTLETKITYYQQAARQGHSGAEQRLAEIERSFLELDILQISDDDFKTLKSVSNAMGGVISLKLLTCLEKGPKRFRDPKLAGEIRGKLAQHSPEERFKLARVMLEIEASSTKLIEEKNAAPFVELLSIESLHEKILAVLVNKENSITSRYILACTIHDYFEASKAPALEGINAAALWVISQAADLENDHAKIRLANLMMEDANEGEKRNAITSLVAGVVNRRGISPKIIADAIKKIDGLLDIQGILDPSLSVEFYTDFCAIAEMSDKTRFKLSQRITQLAIEVARGGRGDDAALLQKESAKLLAASSNSYDPAKIALISLFYEGVVDIEQIKKFRKWHDIANINDANMAARIYEIGNSADAEAQKLLQVEFTHYCKLSSEKEELKARCPNWAAIIDDMLKAEADALEKARKEEAGAKAAKAAVTAKNPREQQAERARQTKEIEARKKQEEAEAKKRAEAEKKQKLEASKAADLAKQAELAKKEEEKRLATLEAERIKAAEQKEGALRAEEKRRLEAEAKAKLEQDALDEKLRALEEAKLKADEAKLKAQQAKLQAQQEKLEREKAEERSRQVGQMQEFLSKSPTINSVADLPEFLRKPFADLLRQGHEIFVKGSAVYQNPHKKRRQPKDLDIEVFFADISKLSEDEIKAFIQQSFGIRAEDIKIIKGRDPVQGEYFTIRAKDEERGIDLAVYDKNIPPVGRLSWTVSVEKRVIFGADGKAVLGHPRGFEEYISALEKSKDPQKQKLARLFFLDNKHHLDNLLTRTEISELAALVDEFKVPIKGGELIFPNPDARGFCMRLAFLIAIEQIEERELDFIFMAAAVARPASLNPIDLLHRELKVETLAGQPPQKIEEQVRVAINSFIKNHSLAEDNLQSKFLSALFEMANKGVDRDKLSAEDAIILGTIWKMNEECRGAELPLAQAAAQQAAFASAAPQPRQAASHERESPPSAQGVVDPSNSRLQSSRTASLAVKPS